MLAKHVGLVCAAAMSMVTMVAEGADFPSNLVADGIPAIPDEVREKAARYLDFRTAAFQSWHPKRK